MWKGLSKSEVFPGFWGNPKVTQSLAQSLETKKIANTMLFTGPYGSGRKTLAERVAQKLFCPEQCGVCPNCRMLAKGIHPDFLLITPEGNTLKLEQARQVKAFLSAPPNTADCKVAVLENCQTLTVEAGNSLLKILEEPPASSVCIMTADTADNVLPTLVSRSQVYKLTPLPNAIIEEVLQGKKLPEPKVRFLTGFAQGVLGTALELMENRDFWQQRENIATEICEILARRRDPLLSSEHWHTLPDRILDLLEFWLRDMLMLQTQRDYEPINGDMLNQLQECIAACPADKTVILLEECVQARQYLTARCNSQLVFDSLALKMWEV